MFDSKFIYAAILAMVCLAAASVFSTQYMLENDYRALLKTGMDFGAIKYASLCAFIIIPLAIYLLGIFLLKADEFHAFAIAIVVALSASNFESLYSMSPLIGTVLGKQYDMIYAASGAFLGIAGLSCFLDLEKRKIGAILSALGLVLMLIFPAFGIMLAALGAISAIGLLEDKTKSSIVLAIFACGFAFQIAYSGELIGALAFSIMAIAVAYILSSVHEMGTKETAAFCLLVMTTVAMLGMQHAIAAKASGIDGGEVAAYIAAGNMNGTIGVLDRPYTFEYYSGKTPVLLNLMELAKKPDVHASMVFYSKRSLTQAYANSSIILPYYGAAYVNSGNSTYEYQEFLNGRYVLEMHSYNGNVLVTDASLVNLLNGETTSIPFTKIRPIYGQNYTQNDSIVANVLEINNRGLYSILFPKNLLFEHNGSRIVMVS